VLVVKAIVAAPDSVVEMLDAVADVESHVVGLLHDVQLAPKQHGALSPGSQNPNKVPV
jgi:hypothetical protein